MPKTGASAKPVVSILWSDVTREKVDLTASCLRSSVRIGFAMGGSYVIRVEEGRRLIVDAANGALKSDVPNLDSVLHVCVGSAPNHVRMLLRRKDGMLALDDLGLPAGVPIAWPAFSGNAAEDPLVLIGASQSKVVFLESRTGRVAILDLASRCWSAMSDNRCAGWTTACVDGSGTVWGINALGLPEERGLQWFDIGSAAVATLPLRMHGTRVVALRGCVLVCGEDVLEVAPDRGSLVTVFRGPVLDIIAADDLTMLWLVRPRRVSLVDRATWTEIAGADIPFVIERAVADEFGRSLALIAHGRVCVVARTQSR